MNRMEAMRRALTALLAGAALAALAGCAGKVILKERRAEIDPVLSLPARDLAAFNARVALLDGALTRTSTPAAEPYGPLLADRVAMAAALEALAKDQEAAAAFEGDFDFFAATHAEIDPKSGDWTAYGQLEGRYPGIRDAIRSHHHAFAGPAADFDALTTVAGIACTDRTALLAALDAGCAELDRGVKRMEDRVQSSLIAVAADQSIQVPQDLKDQRRSILDTLQRHLLKTEELLRHAKEDADAVRASLGTADSLWSGPGLVDDGSRRAGFDRRLAAFRRRRAEFKDLAQTFDQVGR